MRESRAARFTMVPDTKTLSKNHLYFRNGNSLFSLFPFNYKLWFDSWFFLLAWSCNILQPHQNLRRENNHNAQMAGKWRALCSAVDYAYGHRYGKSIDYLNALINNSLWNQADLAPLPWHSSPIGALPPQPQLVIHQAVLNALAPSVPLRAIFSRQHGNNWEFGQHKKNGFVSLGILSSKFNSVKMTQFNTDIFSWFFNIFLQITSSHYHSKFRCAWGVTIPIFDALGGHHSSFRCTWGVTIRIFDALGNQKTCPNRFRCTFPRMIHSYFRCTYGQPTTFSMYLVWFWGSNPGFRWTWGSLTGSKQLFDGVFGDQTIENVSEPSQTSSSALILTPWLNIFFDGVFGPGTIENPRFGNKCSISKIKVWKWFWAHPSKPMLFDGVFDHDTIDFMLGLPNIFQCTCWGSTSQNLMR